MDREVVGSASRVGKTFDARIHRVSNSGNGIVETTSENINLGPVEKDAVGKRIEALKLPGAFARIKRPKHILPSNYIDEHPSLAKGRTEVQQ